MAMVGVDQGPWKGKGEAGGWVDGSCTMLESICTVKQKDEEIIERGMGGDASFLTVRRKGN